MGSSLPQERADAEPARLSGPFDRVGPVLTSRETEVLLCVAKGFTNAEIAQELGIARGTVKSHLSSAFAKLQVSNRTQAAIAMLAEMDDDRYPDRARTSDPPASSRGQAPSSPRIGSTDHATRDHRRPTA